MVRNKGLISILLTAMVSLVVFVTAGITIAGKSSQVFAGDGYILTAAEVSAENGGEAEASVKPEPMYFSAGTKYQGKYPQSAVFTDVQGNKRAVDFYSFIHYADESVSALTDGVLVNMDDINTGIVNHYGLRSGVVMAANGGGYTVENNGNQMNFHNFFWKLSDSHFLLRSDNLTLSLPDGTQQTIDSFLEAHYIEDGIIQLTDKENRWQVVADGTMIQMANGTSYDFGDKIVRDADGNSRLTYHEMLLGADDNIQVQSAEEWVAPEFDFEVIDGQEGQDGEAGEEGEGGNVGQAGEAGQLGQDGEAGDEGGGGDDGETGNEGTHGRSGSSGKAGTAGVNAASGQKGADGSLTDKETQAQAAFNITDFELTSGSLKVTFKVVDDDGALTAKGSVRLLDTKGNEIEDWVFTDGQLNADDNGSLDFSDGSEYVLFWDNLNPDVEYRLIVSSEYVLKNINGQRDYINRTFFTDSTGMQLEKVYATENSFSMILTKKEYSEATGAKITILNASGDTMMTYNVSSGEFGGSDTLELNTDYGFTVNDPLTSNTSYVVKLESMVGSDLKDNGNTQTWKTLKKKPVLGKAKGFANSHTFFHLSVNDVKDDDGAITKYRYDVFLAGSSTVEASIESNDIKNVPLYIDDKIKREVSYQVQVTAIYYDNEKTAEAESLISDAFTMADAGDVSITFEWDPSADRATQIKGNLRIAPKNLGFIGIGPDYPLTVQVESSGYYFRKFEYNKAEMDGHLSNGVYNIPMNIIGLKTKSPYVISVWGFVKQGSGSNDYKHQLIGDYVVNTIDHTRIKVHMEKAGNGSAVGTFIYLGPEDDVTDPADYDLSYKSIRAVEVKLYTGATPNDNNLVATGIAVDDISNHNEPYKNTIASTYYGAKGRVEGQQIYVDEGTFLRTTNELTATQYCVEISAIYDYTYHFVYDGDERTNTYYNSLPIEDGCLKSLPINVNNKLPDFPKPENTGVLATPITFGELSKLGISYEGADKDDYLEDTIVGYTLQARFDNSGSLAKSVTYYAFTQADLNEYKADTNASKGEDVMIWRKANPQTRPWMQVTLPVGSGSNDLTAVHVLFMPPTTGGTPIDTLRNNLLESEADDNTTDSVSGIYDTYLSGSTPVVFAKDLERGWHYIFSYTARLDFGNPNYKYPNNYTGRFIAGQTLLSTPATDTPKQKADVKMYLHKTTEDSGNVTRGYADWKYQYKDLDGTLKKPFSGINTFADIKEVFIGTHSTDDILTAPADPSGLDNGYKTLRVRPTGGMKYLIKMKQNLYHADNRVNSSGDKAPENDEELVDCQFTLPLTAATVADPGDGVSISLEPPLAGNTIRFIFSFGSSVSDLKNRIERIRIWAVDSGGQTINGSAQDFYDFSGVTTSTLPYIGYDLSRAGSKNDVVKFRVSIIYDSGYGGQWYVDNASGTDRFAIQTVVGNYVVRRYATNSLGATVPVNNKNNTSAWYSSYAVTPTAITSDAKYKADKAWKVINIHSTIQDPNDAAYPQPVLNLRYTKSGANDVEEGNNPIFKRLDTATYGTDGSLNYTIGDLTPSINRVYFTRGLTTLRATLATNSYQLIDTTTPSGLASGKYIHVKISRYQNDNPEGSTGGVVKETDVEITSPDATANYEFLVEGLEAGGYYRVELTCKQSGSDVYLWDTDRDQDTIYSIQLLDMMSITDMAFSDIVYETYQKKYVTLGYTLELTDGFEIQYSLEKLQAGGSYAPHAGHDAIMEMMGYRLKDGVWGKDGSGGSFIPWTRMSSMVEIINLAPGGIMSPGNTYQLTIKAVDPSNAVVGETKEVFTWPVLSKSDFYITTTPGENGDNIRVNLDPIDTNKVIVDGKYYVVLWDGNAIRSFNAFNVDEGLKTGISIVGLTANTSYTLAIYALTDMNNAGGAPGLSMTQAELEAKTPAERAALLIYQSTERTMEAWGGRYDSFNIRFNSSSNIRIDMFNAYNLSEVDEIRATVYKDGTTWNFTARRAGNSNNMFIPIGSSTTDFSTVLITDGSLSASGVYSITCSFRKDEGELFRETKNAVLD